METFFLDAMMTALPKIQALLLAGVSFLRFDHPFTTVVIAALFSHCWPPTPSKKIENFLLASLEHGVCHLPLPL
jgi:hypothetical protein